jgi:hypothetical protein
LDVDGGDVGRKNDKEETTAPYEEVAMERLLVLGVAKPWPYWFAPILLTAAVTFVVGMAIAYYRKVALPHYKWLRYEAEQQRRRTAESDPRSQVDHEHREAA